MEAICKLMKRFGYILLMLASLALSCTREPSPGHDSSENSFKTIHYKVQVSSSDDTKATTADNNTKYVFQATDSLYVSSTDSNTGEVQLFGVLKLIYGAGETTAYFEGDLVGVNEFEPASDTPIDVTLVSSGDRIHTTGGGKLTGTSYPANEYAADLAEAVQKFSHFTCSTTFGATHFTLSQNTSFLIFNIKLKPSEAPAGTPVTLTISNGSTPVWSTTVDAAAYNTITRAYFVAGLEGGETTLSSAKLSLSWTNNQTDYSKEFDDLVDGTLAANHYYTVVRSALTFDGFRIRAQEDGTKVYFYYTDGSVQYSTDYGETWNTPPTQANGGINLDADEEACFRGTRTDCNLAGNKQLFTTNSKLCYIAGDITSLLADPTTLATNAFRGAFSKKNTNDSKIDNDKPNDAITVNAGDRVTWVDIDPTDPLILPAITATNCYMDMFMGCTSLTSAPELPATVLADKCYCRMFHSCSGLTSIPSFPSVVTMAGTSTCRRYCYQMFQSSGVTALTGSLFGGTMTLAPYCFEDMFANCTGLTSVSSNFLPATTLAASCYRGMFQNTPITSAPDLLAETLVSYCYRYMFNKCTSLSYIKCYSTTNVTGDSYTQNWLQNANSTGEFHYRSGTTWYTNNQHGIPSGWTPVADTVQ